MAKRGAKRETNAQLAVFEDEHRRIAMDFNPEMPARVGPGVETILQDCSQIWQVAECFAGHCPHKQLL